MWSARCCSVAAVALVAIGWANARAFPADGPATAPATRPADLATLRAERIEVIRSMLQIATEREAMGRPALEGGGVERYRRMLLEAELEAAASRERRIALLRAEADAAEGAERRVRALHDNGRIGNDALLEARAYRLEIEIRWAKEGAGS